VLIFSERHLRHVLAEYVGISTAGGHTGRLINARLVRRRSLLNAILVATSSRRRCLVGSITSTIWPHDQPKWGFCALQDCIFTLQMSRFATMRRVKHRASLALVAVRVRAQVALDIVERSVGTADTGARPRSCSSAHWRSAFSRILPRHRHTPPVLGGMLAQRNGDVSGWPLFGEKERLGRQSLTFH
jgi:hypothetical protein